MFSRHHRKARLLFGLSDLVLTAIAFEAAYQTRSLLPFENDFYIPVAEKALLLGASILTWLLTGYWLDVYDRLDAGNPRIMLRDSFRQCTIGAISLVLLEFVLRLDLSRSFVILLASYSWVLLCLFRWKAGSLVGVIRREFGAPHYVMVVGLSERARNLGRTLEQSSKYGIRLVGFLSDEARHHVPFVKLENRYDVFPMSSLTGILARQVIDEIIFAVDSKRLSELEEVFLLCDEEGVRTRVAVDFFPHVNSDMYLERLGTAPLLTFSAAPHDEIRLFLKRVIDVLLAIAALIFLLPLMLGIALIIRVTSPGPAIFRQVRCGLNGRRFVFYKFRSMCHNAEELKAQLQHLNQKETAFKIPRDPRLTRIGRYIRKFSIDEWPQLWNVIKGDMSIVGPRPAVPEEVENYKRWQRRRLRMRPGLTCLWAVSGRDNLDFETWMKLDMQYIDSWSLVLDWKIILRTIPNVLLGKGAH
ncbi:MAG TPA: sugar transferase [Bryobacteraceae bacterium]|nr:sugar transferase [Bryobacteraceae bacterium]